MPSDVKESTDCCLGCSKVCTECGFPALKAEAKDFISEKLFNLIKKKKNKDEKQASCCLKMIG